MRDPIDRQIRELITDRHTQPRELDELVRPNGEMDVWDDDSEDDEQDE